jgi:two-component system, NtrC family, response regulator AtoC
MSIELFPSGNAPRTTSLSSDFSAPRNWASSSRPFAVGAAHGTTETFAGKLHFVSSSPEMLRVRKQVEKVAGFDIPVLILGETGTGKEVLARLIHSRSSRAASPFLKVNCAALPDGLLESELFGYERGAFTGAVTSKPGKFEMCHQGTILLDEIGDMPAHLQAKLLHVLEDKCYFRLGGHDLIHVDVRILAATNVDIREAIKSQKLREDLYYRLNSFAIQVPPLRSRRDEIPVLFEHFLGRFASDYNFPVPFLSTRLVHACLNYSWPGNIRELQSFAQRLVIQQNEEQVIQELNADGQTARPQCSAFEKNLEARPKDLKALGRQRKQNAEKTVIARVLRETHYNRKITAERLQISSKALFNKIHQYGLAWKGPQASTGREDPAA